jgi:hypothetical protein
LLRFQSTRTLRSNKHITAPHFLFPHPHSQSNSNSTYYRTTLPIPSPALSIPLLLTRIPHHVSYSLNRTLNPIPPYYHTTRHFLFPQPHSQSHSFLTHYRTTLPIPSTAIPIPILLIIPHNTSYPLPRTLDPVPPYYNTAPRFLFSLPPTQSHSNRTYYRTSLPMPAHALSIPFLLILLPQRPS